MSTENTAKNVVEMKAAEPSVPKPAVVEPEVTPPKSNRRRYLIMASVPLLLLAVGGWFWLTGGRYASTDNAYLQQDRVTITADVSGRIVEATVRENEAVKEGQLLFRINPEPYRIALAGADAALASARLQVEQYRAAYEQAEASAKWASENLDFKQKALDRARDLLKKGVASQATYDSAENDVRSAEQALSQADQNIEAAKASLGGDPAIATDQHPAVLAALARRDQAALDLENTEVHAPADGIVAQADRLKVGQYVTNPTGNPTALMSLVETGDSWVDANFKETDLTRMSVGQKATVTFDAYPGQAVEGVVDSIGAGTGAEFSVLPAQNATGNWVKVVQRVPVRIRLVDPPAEVPLRTGLSASVEVDLKNSGTTVGFLGASPASANPSTPQ